MTERRKPRASPSSPDSRPSDGCARLFFRNPSLVLAVTVCLVSILAYLPAWRAGFVLDDEAISKNDLLKTPAGLFKIWTDPLANGKEEHFWPLVYTTFWIEHHLWGARPLGYHLVNLLLHVLNSILIGLLLSRMQIKSAWLAAAIFALHPVHVESVAWAIERKDVLSGLFYLLAFFAYLRFDEKRSLICYAIALACFACAMISKSIVVTFPLALSLWLWWRIDRAPGRSLAKSLLPVAPFLLMAAALALHDLTWVRRHAGFHPGFGLPERLSISARAMAFYAQKLIWPVNLMAQYPEWKPNPMWVVALLFLLAILIGTGLFYSRGARTTQARWLVLGVLFYILTLLPILGFVDFGFMRYSLVADRFQYLASIGPIATFSSALVHLVQRLLNKSIGAFVVLAFPLPLAILTMKQASLYENKETLFSQNLAKNPEAWLACHDLGLERAQRGEKEKAADFFSKALQIKPDYEEALNNLGTIRWQQGKVDEAEGLYERAIRVNPAYWDAYHNLGTTLIQERKFSQAEHCYSRLLQLRPGDAIACNGLGIVCLNLDRCEEAEKMFVKAAGFAPGFVDALTNAAKVQGQQGNLADAERNFLKALQIDSSNALVLAGLGTVRHKQGRRDEARDFYLRAIAAAPNYVEALMNLGTLDGEEGRLDEAVSYFNRALSINPDSAKILNQRGIAKYNLGRPAEAIDDFTRALQLAPDYTEAASNLKKANAASDSIARGKQVSLIP